MHQSLSMSRNDLFLCTERSETRRFGRNASETDLYRSYPADSGDPLVGTFALSERRLMRRFATGANVVSVSTGDIFRFLS